eukprot:CAMPEP_0176340468 /NCGR_PEP_ID=MMETSP0126-20121128/1590_1 /TAXON_ID=141414 ORGANISM="Strombidinopsis acuminatum, Strain SPMC142" /NCGR_SAMPLE_ID=MMETSP0126 /ASSEMBLY_ACC=CAM_ASM_000229 /LENGTH=43 /DNA_ID= /DNA_START= /DNA_END= /DNA_ORIENTATION=
MNQLTDDSDTDGDYDEHDDFDITKAKFDNPTADALKVFKPDDD